MGSARRFPLDDPAASPATDRAAPRWPMLAQIAEIARTSEPASDRSTYRVDPPHASATSPSHVAPESPARSLEQSGINLPNVEDSDTEREHRVLAAVPMPIRIAVEGWRLIQPHRELIRFAAMLALMAAGGVSMSMIMGSRLKPVDASPSPETSAADHTTAGETSLQSAELLPVLEPANVPDAKSSSLVPTASGPLAPRTAPLMAIEANNDEPAALARPTPSPIAPPYPTTPYPTATLPSMAADALPQVRMNEPEVARFRGDLLKIQTR